MTAVIFTTNIGSPIADVLGIRANYDGGTDTLTVDNAVVGLGGDDSIGSTFLPIDIGGQLFSFTITLDGGDGNDGVTGSNATDILIGGTGNDTVSGVSGNTMSGGADIDTLGLSTPTFAAALIVNYAAQAAAAVTLSDGSTISGFERFFIQSGAGNDVLDLSGDANALDSNFASFDGDDTLRVNAATQGGIVFNSGLGSDRIVADLSALASTVQLISLSPVGPGGSLIAAGLTVGSNDVERFEVTTGSGNDNLSGGGFADILAGGAGNDTLDGGGGGDTLDGGAGNDVVSDGDGVDSAHGGTGNDTFFLAADGLNDTLAGDAGFDTIDLSLAAAAVTANFVAGTLGGAGLGTTTVSGIERIFGSGFGDTLLGGAAGETLIGNGGNDLIAGNAGNDIITGNGGNDVINDGLGSDNVSGGGDNDTIYLAADAANDTIGGDVGTDTLDLFHATSGASLVFGAVAFAGTAFGGGLGSNSFSGIERVIGSTFADTLTGATSNEYFFSRAGADTIFGAAGNDQIFGDVGADRLTGAAGADTIFGGADSDTFVFSHLSQGADIFGDFATAIDKIEIARAGFGLAAGYVLNFQVGAAAVGAGQVFLFNAATKQFSFDSNGAAAGGTTLLATLSVGSVAAGDIVLV